MKDQEGSPSPAPPRFASPRAEAGPRYLIRATTLMAPPAAGHETRSSEPAPSRALRARPAALRRLPAPAAKQPLRRGSRGDADVGSVPEACGRVGPGLPLARAAPGPCEARRGLGSGPAAGAGQPRGL